MLLCRKDMSTKWFFVTKTNFNSNANEAIAMAHSVTLCSLPLSTLKTFYTYVFD